ncbi:MAG: hypothetical protein KGI82_04265, partial [Betaproteobacteria bacterium]|nr:hypothetical protein [Betaproteobacteria bacterium]
ETAPMIVWIAHAKVGHRQTPYTLPSPATKKPLSHQAQGLFYFSPAPQGVRYHQFQCGPKNNT